MYLAKRWIGAQNALAEFDSVSAEICCHVSYVALLHKSPFSQCCRWRGPHPCCMCRFHICCKDLGKVFEQHLSLQFSLDFCSDGVQNYVQFTCEPLTGPCGSGRMSGADLRSAFIDSIFLRVPTQR